MSRSALDGAVAHRWIAGAVAIACALVALTLADRRDDERTLRNANLAAASGRFDDASRLAATLQEGTTAADAWYLRAHVAILEHRFESAAAALRRSIELRPNDWRAHQDLSVVLPVIGQPGAARRAHRRAVSLNPKLG